MAYVAINSGELNNKGFLESPIKRTEGDGGKPTVDYAAYAEVWAKIDMRGASEVIVADGSRATAAADLTIRWRSDVKSDHRFRRKHDGALFYFVGPPLDMDPGRKVGLMLNAVFVETRK